MKDDSFYVIFNAHYEPLQFAVPPEQFAARWIRVLDTSTENAPELRRLRRAEKLEPGAKIDVQARSLVVLRSAK